MKMTGEVGPSGDLKIEMYSKKTGGTPLAAIDLASTIQDGSISASGRFRKGRGATIAWHKD